MNKLFTLSQRGLKINWRLLEIGLYGTPHSPPEISKSDICDYLCVILDGNPENFDEISELLCYCGDGSFDCDKFRELFYSYLEKENASREIALQKWLILKINELIFSENKDMQVDKFTLLELLSNHDYNYTTNFLERYDDSNFARSDSDTYVHFIHNLLVDTPNFYSDTYLFCMEELQTIIEEGKDDLSLDLKNITQVFTLLNDNDYGKKLCGIEEAKNLCDLSPLILGANGKGGWEDSARALFALSDQRLLPYLPMIFEWTSDLNWPGADIINDRLEIFDPELLAKPLTDYFAEKNTLTTDEWCELCSYLDSDEHKKHYRDEHYSIPPHLKEIYERWSDDPFRLSNMHFIAANKALFALLPDSITAIFDDVAIDRENLYYKQDATTEIGRLYNMLHCHSRFDVQLAGIEIASNLEDITPIVLPDYEGSGWVVENCARAIYNCTDSKLAPHIDRLKMWAETRYIKDSDSTHYTGYDIIKSRLIRYKCDR